MTRVNRTRHAIGLTLIAALGWGCGGDAGKVTGATPGPVSSETPGSAPTAKGAVTVALRDPFLFDHNARFFGGRTFRWVAPVPIHIVTGDPVFDGFLLAQFSAWEAALAGAGGRPFYSVRPAAPGTPASGIFLEVVDLPGSVVGVGDPFSVFEGRQADPALGEGWRRLPRVGARGQVEVPQIQANGRIRTCLLSLDPAIFGSAEVAAAVIRHEVGHCLGFIGHVSNPQSLMHATSCCPLTITGDVSGMMRRLYRLAPGTRVTR